jgi:hypothetical protein
MLSCRTGHLLSKKQSLGELLLPRRRAVNSCSPAAVLQGAALLASRAVDNCFFKKQG